MLKEKIYHIIEKGSHGSKANLIFDYFIMILIILNTISIILETISEVHLEHSYYLNIFDVVSVIIFTIEYLLRIYVSELSHPSGSKFKSALKYIFSASGLIDLIAILPFYLPYLIKTDLRFIRILRLTRFLRILKISRYNSSLSLIWKVVSEKKSELAMTGFITVLILFVSSFMIYYAEGEAQPDKFPNILHGFWWAIATLTTVGYGDVFPVTPIGKIISGVIAILGIGLVALPTGLVSAGFMEKIGEKKREIKICPHCGKEIEE